jgi:hypothetical protein
MTQEIIDRVLLMRDEKVTPPIHAILFRDTGPKPNYFAGG